MAALLSLLLTLLLTAQLSHRPQPWKAAHGGALPWADRTGDYKTAVAGPILIGALFLTVSVIAGPKHPVLAIIALSICLGFIYCYAAYWAAVTSFVAGDVMAIVMGTINAIGNLGGFVGPFVVGFLIDRTKTPLVGEAFLIACLIISGLFALRLNNRTKMEIAVSKSSIQVSK